MSESKLREFCLTADLVDKKTFHACVAKLHEENKLMREALEHIAGVYCDCVSDESLDRHYENVARECLGRLK